MFAFESDFVASLRCVPMAVRLKLDLCGIKLFLRQWSRFTREDRYALLMRRCGDSGEIAAYREALTTLIGERTGEIARLLTDAPCGQWDIAERAAAAVTGYAWSLGLSPPSARQWAALSRLQRFALIKLTRDNHDNVNFAPAMREFGLVAEAGSGQRDRRSASRWLSPARSSAVIRSRARGRTTAFSSAR
jgi:hypothetical protein